MPKSSSPNVHTPEGKIARFVDFLNGGKALREKQRLHESRIRIKENFLQVKRICDSTQARTDQVLASSNEYLQSRGQRLDS